MVENRADLGNAIALNSSMVNLARLLGPSIAGVVIAATNEGWCFLIDGVSYVAVIVALLRMNIAAPPERPVAPTARFISSAKGSRTCSGFDRSARSSCFSHSSVSSVCLTRC
jgi:MFS family permease